MAAKKKSILTQFQPATDRQRLHARITGAIIGTSMLGVVTAFAIAPDSFPEHLPMETVVQPLPAPAALVEPYGATRYLREDHVLSRDTVATLLNRLAIADAAALDFILTAPSAQAISRQMRPGKIVSAYTDAGGHLLRLNFPLNGDRDSYLVVERSEKGLNAFEETPTVQHHVALRSGEITSSLFGATDAAGIPDSIATELADIFGGEIDFHRDLRKGDRFAVRYETASIRGQVVRTGKILAAEFVNSGRTLRAFYHGSADGNGGYYDSEGKSLRKAFLRSPLEFSRVTSGFSAARLHPVLKEWRAHRGVDYGAAIGTRVRSTGDGTVEFAGRQGGYGNLVIVRHRGEFSTAYGHLNAFAAGIRKGTRINQGDIIGFVGQTGLASGPHLHYEFRVRDAQVNPLTIALPEAPPLDAHTLAAFKPIAQEAISHFEVARSSTTSQFE